jgi:glycyl-tRNA synthetase beta chain
MELVFEIGCEELPASFQRPAVEFLRDGLRGELREARLSGEALTEKALAGGQPATDLYRAFATPRRLAVICRDVLERAPDAEKLLQGPPVKTAFGPDGKPTQAALGFARKAGVPVQALRPEGERVVALQTLKGQGAREALPAILERLMAGIPFRKAMRWGDGSATFARPVHWIAAALDGERIALSYGDVTSGLASRGHRFHAPGEFPLPRADGYVSALRDRHVLADWDERRNEIWARVNDAASGAGPGARPRRDDELLETVTGLVEEPTGVLGRFEVHFLELPEAVLVSEMRDHQK